MDMEQVLQAFFAESEELLQMMESALLRLESEPEDVDAINSVFRAAHTIKGSAGLFDLDRIVAFTHLVESLLDRVRGGMVRIDDQLIALLLACKDHIHDLLQSVANNHQDLDGEVRHDEESLLEQLNLLLGQKMQSESGAVAAPPLQMPPARDARAQPTANENWHISLRFGGSVLRNGMEPLSFIRYLGTLGEIIELETLFDSIPVADAMDAESCYLGFEIEYDSDASQASIENVFEFVADDCQIKILAPHSPISQYADLIDSLPENRSQLGQLLRKMGALTEIELESLQLPPLEEAPATTEAPVVAAGPDTPSPKAAVDAAAEPKPKRGAEAKGADARHVRVLADKLDQLINYVGELMIAGAGVNMLAQQSGDSELLEATSVISRLVEDIRDSALRLRMVEIGETFSRFHRIVRDVSRELGKEIELVVSGSETDLDKTMVEKIADPLVHLVRNAIDHGIEPATVRRASGKDEKGTVSLKAFHDSGSIVIQVGDDGGGLRRDKIVQKAIARGLIQRGEELSDTDAFNLIFEPGFSTAEQVTNLSGRGVGLDVVKRNIEALRGAVEIESEEGRGTNVTIRLPLTLAIIDGFLVRIGKYPYQVPLDMVRECVEVSAAWRESGQNLDYINLRGEVLPILDVGELFNLGQSGSRRRSILVVQYAGQKAGLIVDDLLGESQVVIKPLGRMFSELRGVSGSTILGNGEVALILDVPALIQLAAGEEARMVAKIQENALAVH